MEIFVYSDESGTFDCYHSRLFVFGGVAYLSAETMQSSLRRYRSVETAVRSLIGLPEPQELKAVLLSPENRKRLFRVTNREFRFGVIIEIPKLRIRPYIADDKKARQRYMDYAFKIAVKRFFQTLIRDGAIIPDQVSSVHFFVDQHTTATNGRYELREGLEQELIRGTINFEYQTRYPPLFPKASSVTLKYCDSKHVPLIRAADIIANRIYHLAVSQQFCLCNSPHFHVIHQP